MASLLTRCPVCGNSLHVAELHCPQCQTSVRGTFDSCRFCRLAEEHLRFIETFLRCEGNLSRVERELGISYPTVRNRLQSALVALGLQGRDSVSEDSSSTASVRAQRLEILEALANGEIDAAEAAEALRQLI
ncbi:hypothetical protein CWRG_01971 [Chthonomonas calidirosea]|uniref:Uncharacterized protein conserved in bacteria n=1 Tax=Chthonomonas calidirosea (strain DSM 23976 / ICMP 18418 / T49) TaxID=1303518 RepID=S0EVU1_CHTCT|nr:DUF2089 domain-containing protein [Chthonomonas calidirosea]CCW35911.1 Uncharacterized protein conserved in bacteria [Chthonomonas calidirosea T49]CEK17848.1 hypothetical protein CWRG_01971 [Chthonomonas calidirosea]CEK17849.1 hypothetical protein CP488_01986 [Chthonomonas calidirosea]CEK18881.1 hypothetical protein CTKA_01990 [Chthonomonas calidirosea]